MKIWSHKTTLTFFNDIIFIGLLHFTKIYLIVKQELRGKSGIYEFICETTGKLYIGSSVNLLSRLNDHLKGGGVNLIFNFKML